MFRKGHGIEIVQVDQPKVYCIVQIFKLFVHDLIVLKLETEAGIEPALVPYPSLTHSNYALLFRSTFTVTIGFGLASYSYKANL